METYSDTTCITQGVRVELTRCAVRVCMQPWQLLVWGAPMWIAFSVHACER